MMKCCAGHQVSDKKIHTHIRVYCIVRHKSLLSLDLDLMSSSFDCRNDQRVVRSSEYVCKMRELESIRLRSKSMDVTTEKAACQEQVAEIALSIYECLHANAKIISSRFNKEQRKMVKKISGQSRVDEIDRIVALDLHEVYSQMNRLSNNQGEFDPTQYANANKQTQAYDKVQG